MNINQFRAKLEAEGFETVKLRLQDQNNYTDNYRAAAIAWVGEIEAQRGKDEEALREASRREQMEIARSAKNAAWAAAIAAIIAAIAAVVSIAINMNQPPA
jgi:hypothetical protein